jgi:Ca2+-transporting ATPase
VIHIQHDKVPGRTRYRVEGLFRSEGLGVLLQGVLREHPVVREVRASALTGNVLVHYNATLDAQTMAAVIEDVWNRIQGNRDGDIDNPGVQDENKTLMKPVKERINRGKQALIDAIDHVLPGLEEQTALDWHSLDKTDAVVKLQSNAEYGLTHAEAERRQKRFGPNTLMAVKPRSDWEIIFDQLNSLPTYLLAAAAGVSILTGGLLDAVVVVGVVVANAAIGYSTEKAAEQTIHSLQNLVQPSTFVSRHGKTKELPIENVVPGDVLEKGA